MGSCYVQVGTTQHKESVITGILEQIISLIIDGDDFSQVIGLEVAAM